MDDLKFMVIFMVKVTSSQFSLLYFLFLFGKAEIKMSVTTVHSTYWKHHQFVRRKNPNKWKIHLRAEDEFIPPISYHVCSTLAVLGSHRGPQLIYTGLYIWYFSEPEWTIWKMSSCVLFGGLIYMEKTIFFFLM